MINPTRSELLTNVVDYIELATSLSRDVIIRGKQNAPVPSGSYCTIVYVAGDSDGTSVIKTSEIDGDDTQLDYLMRAKRTYTFSVQFYRDNATDYAKRVMMFHETPTGQEFQQASYFTVNNIMSVSEAAEVLSNNYEERAILNLEILVAERQDLIVNRVAEVTVELKLDDIIEETIEVKNV